MRLDQLAKFRPPEEVAVTSAFREERHATNTKDSAKFAEAQVRVRYLTEHQDHQDGVERSRMKGQSRGIELDEPDVGLGLGSLTSEPQHR